MTDTSGDDVAVPEDAGSTTASDEASPDDLPGVTAGDVDSVDDDASPGSPRADTREVGLGDGDDVQPGAGAIEPPD
jgi:hypothetical protein